MGTHDHLRPPPLSQAIGPLSALSFSPSFPSSALDAGKTLRNQRLHKTWCHQPAGRCQTPGWTVGTSCSLAPPECRHVTLSSLLVCGLPSQVTAAPSRVDGSKAHMGSLKRVGHVMICHDPSKRILRERRTWKIRQVAQ